MRRSHNVVILNVGPALFIIVLFNCFRIILHPVLKEGKFPIEKTLTTQLT